MHDEYDIDQTYAIGAWLLVRGGLSRPEFEEGMRRRRVRHPLLHEWIVSGRVPELLDATEENRRRYGHPSKDAAPVVDPHLRRYAGHLVGRFPDAFARGDQPMSVRHFRKAFVHGWCLRDEGSVSAEALDMVDGFHAYGCRVLPIAFDGSVLTVAAIHRRSRVFIAEMLDLEPEIDIRVVPTLPPDMRAGLRWYYGRPQYLQLPESE